MTQTQTDITHLTAGFRQARVVLTAVELELFEMLSETAGTTRDIARAKGLDERAARLLLDALVSLNVLEKAGDKYLVAPACRDQLDPASPGNVLPALQHSANLWKSWSDLTQVVRSGAPAPRSPRQDAALESFIGAMAVGARHKARELVGSVDLSGASSVLDLGGGPGSYALEFARSKDDLKVVVFDLPEVVAIAQRHIRAAGLSDRVTTLGGDYTQDPIGGPYDLVWMSSIVHMHSENQNAELIMKAAQALGGHGRVIVRDFLLDEDGTGPVWATLFAINMLVNTQGGRSYKASEIESWMASAGLKHIEVKRMDSDGLVIGSMF